MKTLLISAAAIAAATVFTPVASFAQFAVDTPVGGVRVGSDRGYHREYDRPGYRAYGYEREYRRSGCRTVTIERDDGSFRKIHRCD